MLITHSHSTTCKNIVLHKLLTPIFNSLYTHGLACGEEAGRWQYGNHSFTIINNGVDINRFSFNAESRNTIRQKLDIPNDVILVGNVGNFWGKGKNQSFVVKVFNELYQKNNNYRLCLIGDGSLRVSVEKQVEEFGLKDKVFFIGAINDVDEYLNAIDLILMPSLYEGLPLTLIEQQANGLQCVCSDTITTEADKTGNLKYISLEESAKEWAQKIVSFINIEGREQRSKQAVEDITQAGYSIQEEAKKLEKFYYNKII